MPKEPDTELGREQRLNLERHRDSCTVRLSEAQPLGRRAHDVANPKKQLLEKKHRIGKNVEQARAAAVAANAAVEAAEQELSEVLEQLVAKDAEVKQILDTVPKVPKEKGLEAQIVEVIASVESLSELLKARERGGDAASAFTASLKSVMGQLRPSEQACGPALQPSPAPIILKGSSTSSSSRSRT
ncbi:unnamed protein product [Prorocentrum cordatum]|uniref:Tubulin-specific chaperone A n=1 Tax=Prorocentrum cordatum TaxID=2364126 RepID=A0ABN9TSE9_9DINO|nr:unnamed protein product [Polarella glacialis]